MNDPIEQQIDVVRVAGLRARQTKNEFEHRGMDLHGFAELGEIIPEAVDSSTAFAVAASMLATGKPVYYSNRLRAISTDATFGTTPSRAPNFKKTGPLQVMDIDGIWVFATRVGRLVLTLEDGPLVQIEIDDVNAFVGWLHMTDIDKIVFDDGVLATAAPREWEPGSFIE